MYKFIRIRHDIIKQCHGNYKEMKKVNYKLEIEISRNSTLKNLGVLRGSFSGFGCPKRHPDAVLAKTTVLPLCILPFALPRECYHSGRHWRAGPYLYGSNAVSCRGVFTQEETVLQISTSSGKLSIKAV